LILDNLSTLCRGGKENEAESWLPIQEWVLKLRRYGISVLFDHHAGKGGNQRGTSRREDVLDCVLVLRHPDNYDPSEGARFEIHFEKARNMYGPDCEPFEVQMQTGKDGGALWIMANLENVMASRVQELLGEGMSIREVAEELGIHRSKVERLKKKVQ